MFDARRKTTVIRHTITASLLSVASGPAALIAARPFGCVSSSPAAGTFEIASQARARQTIGTVE